MIFPLAWQGYSLGKAIWKLFQSLVSKAKQILETFYKKYPDIKKHGL
jgi:hypothetical protein